MRSPSAHRARSVYSRRSAASPGSPPGCCSPGACGAREPETSAGVDNILNRTLTAALLAGCTTAALAMAATAPSPPPSSATSGQAQIGSFGLDLEGGDPSVKPGDDFARHANGHWLDTVQIPPDRSSRGTFVMLRERSLQQVRGILEGLSKDSPAGSNEQKLGDFYRAYLDTDAIDRAGLEAIAAAKSHEDLARLMGRQDLGLTTPVAFGIAPDEKDPDHCMVLIGQSGLGMPDRDYYLKDEPVYTELRAKYDAHIERLLKLAGRTDGAEA